MCGGAVVRWCGGACVHACVRAGGRGLYTERASSLHLVECGDLVVAADGEDSAGEQVVLHGEPNPKARPMMHCMPC